MTDQQDPKWYRDQIESLKAENKELRAFRNSTLISDAGLDPVVRKAVLKDIDRGDFAGEMSVDGIRDWAKTEYEWEAPTQTEPEAPEAPAPDVRTDIVQEGSDRLQAIQQFGTPPNDTPDRNSQIANKARQDGDILTAIRASMADQIEM
jgi:hypothetical protein